ncbi:hypothetical protein BC830DRAFT_1144332 [Chytriomyces sp. MP71]|nr:hypothetical protein BC830DRAFT_1144332 [Chytriomyces sp. MP71]
MRGEQGVYERAFAQSRAADNHQIEGESALEKLLFDLRRDAVEADVARERLSFQRGRHVLFGDWNGIFPDDLGMGQTHLHGHRRRLLSQCLSLVHVSDTDWFAETDERLGNEASYYMPQSLKVRTHNGLQNRNGSGGDSVNYPGPAHLSSPNNQCQTKCTYFVFCFS